MYSLPLVLHSFSVPLLLLLLPPLRHEKNATQRVSKEVVELFGKAAELFVAELSLVSWMNVATTKKIMQVSHISNAVAEYHTYDFLSGIVPEPTANKPKRTRVRENRFFLSPARCWHPLRPPSLSFPAYFFFFSTTFFFFFRLFPPLTPSSRPQFLQRKRATTTSNTEVAHSAVELPVGEQEGAASVSSPFPPPQASSPFPPSGPSSSSSHLHLQDGGDPSSVATPTASPLDLHHLQHLQQQHALSLNSRHSAQEDTEEIHHQGEHVHQQLADDDELTATPTHFPSHLYDMPVQSPLTSMPTAPSRAHFSTMNIDASNTGM